MDSTSPDVEYRYLLKKAGERPEGFFESLVEPLKPSGRCSLSPKNWDDTNIESQETFEFVKLNKKFSPHNGARNQFIHAVPPDLLPFGSIS
jgi:hypothetical protein